MQLMSHRTDAPQKRGTYIVMGIKQFSSWFIPCKGKSDLQISFLEELKNAIDQQIWRPVSIKAFLQSGNRLPLLNENKK